MPGSFANGLADYDPPPHLRSPDVAFRCIHLGPTLTPEEVKQYELQLLAGGIPCRQCNGAIPGRHCSHPVEGPFTRIAGKCTSCKVWDGGRLDQQPEQPASSKPTLMPTTQAASTPAPPSPSPS